MNHLGDTNKMSDTPRTDEAQFGTGRVSVSFARQLERELNAALDRIKRLEEAGDAMYENSHPTKWDLREASNRKLKEQDAWRKAKEVKL